MPTRADSAPIVRFGVFELDLRSGELRKSGVRIALPDQPLEILKALLERAGGLVTRDELRQRLWHDDTFVDFEDGLNAAIRRLRDTLGDDAARPRFIETLPRRGYRLIAPLQLDSGVPISTSAEPLQPFSRIGLRAVRSALARPVVPWTMAAVLGVLVAVLAWQRFGAIAPARRPTSRFPVATQPLAVLDHAPSPAVALSRDGTQLAYVAGDGFNGQLYLRALSSLEAAPVAGADRAQGPVFSPDGNWVAFFSRRTLWKIGVRGGSPVTVCALPGLAHGASWGDDGTIVFSANAQLWRVASEGGTPVQFGAPESALWPQILPGNKAIIFTLSQPSPNPGVWLMTLDGGGLRQLVERGGNARYVSSGHLVYASDGALFVAPFDLDGLRVGGPAVTVIPQVLMGLPEEPLIAHYAVSDTGTLAYLPGPPLSNLRVLVWVDRAGREEVLTTEPRAYEWPRLSPDGSRLALSILEADADRNVWVYHFAQKTLMKLTFDPELDDRPLWTPDGASLIFRSLRDGPRAPHIFRTARDGTGVPERLTTEPNFDGTVHSISPDGQTLLFSEWIGGFRYDLRTLSLDGRQSVKPLLSNRLTVGSPAISPDGRWLAYRDNDSGRYEVFVRPFPDVQGGRWQISADGGVAPVWSPDGRELFYRNGQNMMVVDVQTAHGFVSGTARVLFSGNYDPGIAGTRNFDISGDGKRFIMIKELQKTLNASARDELVVVLGWSEELRQRVPSL